MKLTFTYLLAYRIFATVVMALTCIAFISFAVLFLIGIWHPDMTVIGRITGMIIVVAVSAVAVLAFKYLMKVLTWRLQLGKSSLRIKYWPNHKIRVPYTDILLGKADFFGLHVYRFYDIAAGFRIPNFITNRELILLKLHPRIGFKETERRLRPSELIEMLQSGGNMAALFSAYNRAKITILCTIIIVVPICLFNILLGYPYIVALPVSLCAVPFLLWLMYHWRRVSWLEYADLSTLGTGSVITAVYAAAALSPLASVWHNFSLHPDYILFPFALIPSFFAGLVLWRYGFISFHRKDKLFSSLAVGLSLPVYFYALLVAANTLLDHATPLTDNVKVTEVFDPEKARFIPPVVTLAIGEGPDQITSTIIPTFPIIEQLAEGDVIELDVHPGFLGIPWHQYQFSIFNEHELRIIKPTTAERE